MKTSTSWTSAAFEWLFIPTIMALGFGFGHLVVRVFGWRYTDPLSLTTQPFDTSMSIMAYSLYAMVLLPILSIVGYVIGRSMYDNHKMKKSIAA